MKITRLSALGVAFLSVAACSMHQHQGGATATSTDKFQQVFGQWDHPNTTMTLPNGNVLYVFGKGESRAVWTPAASVPGQHLYTVAENGKPARAVVYHGDKKDITDRKNPDPARRRIVWIETDQKGIILLAACQGCTDEEQELLAALPKGENVQLRAATVPE